MFPRMRTCKEAATEIKEVDPGTCISESGLRRLIKEGKIRSVQIGNKQLLNLDQVIAYLNEPFPIEETPEPETSKHIGLDRIELFKQNIGVK